MRYASVCSGVSPHTKAFAAMGWEAVFFAEIEAFPSAVLAHHYPEVPNLGDMTKIDGHAWRGKVDVLLASCPCQAFSVAGLRKSLSDDRGNLTLEFVKLADAIRPRFIVYENVPGILNTDDNAFGCFLGALVGAGSALVPARGQRWTDAGLVVGPERSAAWRVLDAQYFGLAQRRRRVFVVASAGDGADPSQVLLVEEGVPRHTAPRREAGQGATRGVEVGPSGGRFTDLSPTLDARCKDGFIRNQIGVGAVELPDLVGTLSDGAHNGGGLNGQDAYSGRIIPVFGGDDETDTATGYCSGRSTSGDVRDPELHQHHANQGSYCGDGIEVAHALRGEGFDASEDGTGRGTPLVPVLAPTLDARAGRSGETSFATSGGLVPIAFSAKDHGADATPIVYSIMPMNSGKDYKARAVEVAQPVMTAPVGGNQGGDYVVQPVYAVRTAQTSANGHGVAEDVSHTLDGAQGQALWCYPILEAGARTGKSTTDVRAGMGIGEPDDPMFTLQSGKQHAVAAPVAMRESGQGFWMQDEIAGTVDANMGMSGHANRPAVIKQHGMAVRRLLPVECERLQGWEDNYTNVPFRGKPAADGPRYKAIGNGWAVPCLVWIAKKIQAVSAPR